MQWLKDQPLWFRAVVLVTGAVVGMYLLSHFDQASLSSMLQSATFLAVAIYTVLQEMEKYRQRQREQQLEEERKSRDIEVKRTAEKAAAKAEEVKKTLAWTVAKAEQAAAESHDKLDSLMQIGSENSQMGKLNHTLLNSNMQASLKATAIALRQVADLTKGTPAHAANELAAADAERMLKDHEASQSKVDDSMTVQGITKADVTPEKH